MNRRELLGLLAWPSLAQASDASAAVQGLWARYRAGSETEQEHLSLRIEREGATPERKRLQRSIRFRPDGGFLVLVRFSEPALDQGLSLLIDRSAAHGTQMWLRMPSWPQARRIAAEREARSFGGTDLNFEDNRQLLGEATADWSYRQLSEGRIEALPKAASAYGRRLLSLSAEGALAQIEYFDPQGRLLKTQTHEGLTTDAHGRWRARVLRVQQHQEARRSVFEVEQREFGAKLPEAWFHQQLAA